MHGRNGLWAAALGALAGLAMTTPALAAGPNDPVTFSKQIAPIFQVKCQECHQPNSIAPMSLITYKEVRPWARAIKQRVASRQMPPWHIDPSVGVQKFKNDMSLSTEQIDAIVRWVDAGQGPGRVVPPDERHCDHRAALGKDG
jgi:mono/diheme cytochrome c family protein